MGQRANIKFCSCSEGLLIFHRSNPSGFCNLAPLPIYGLTVRSWRTYSSYSWFKRQRQKGTFVTVFLLRLVTWTASRAPLAESEERVGGAKVRWLRERVCETHHCMFIRRFAGCTAALPPSGHFVSWVRAVAQSLQGLCRLHVFSLSVCFSDIVDLLAASREQATSAKLLAGS